MTETDGDATDHRPAKLPILRERRWAVVTWSVIAVLSVLTSVLFTYLWVIGEEPAGLALGSILATIVWIGVGLHEKTLAVIGDFLGYFGWN